MNDEREILRAWLLTNCQQDAEWRVMAREVREAFELDCCGEGSGLRPYGTPGCLSISPRVFTWVVLRTFPGVTRGKSNGSRAYVGLARRPTADCPPAPFPMKNEDRWDYSKY